MRRLSMILSVVAATPLALAAPVLTAPGPHPHPVPPRVSQLRLARTAAADRLGSRPVRTPVVVAADGPTATAGFSAVGVTWAHDRLPRSLDARVRVRSGGRWSGWYDLGGLGDAAPDSASPDRRSGRLRDGTEPLFTGPADGVQAAVTLRSGRLPADLRVELVDPGRSAADGVPASVPASSAEAWTGMPPYISRAGWGADESLRWYNPGCNGAVYYAPTVRMGFVHHTDNVNDYTSSDAYAIVRSIYAYHVISNGWCDIGYNFLVDRFGRIFEGRYGGVDRPVIGAHTGGFNTNSFGAALIGTFDTVTPDASMQGALARLFAWKLGLTYADPTGYATMTAGMFSGSKFPAGSSVTFHVVSGHRDADYTDCPGSDAYAMLTALRTSIRSLMGAGLVTPTVTPDPVPVGAPALTVHAGVLKTQLWTLRITNAVTGVLVRSFSGTTSTGLTVTWNGTDSAGRSVPPASYQLSLTSWSGTDEARPWSVVVPWTAPAVAAVPGAAAGTALVAETTPGGPVQYRTMAAGATPVWSAPVQLGGHAVGGPAAVVPASGGFTVFVRGTDGELYRDVSTDGVTWTGWQSLGGVLTSAPAATVAPDGSVVVLARDGSGVPEQLTLNGGVPGGWTTLGGHMVGDPAVVTLATGAVAAFVTGTNGQVYEKAGSAPWSSIGGSADAGPAAVRVPGTPTVYVAQRVAGRESVSYKVFDGSAWNAWASLGGTTNSAPALTAWAPGHVELYVAGTNGWLYEDAFAAGAWAGFTRGPQL